MCPKCGKTDGFMNVGRDHWFVCEEHKLKWYVGSNLFSGWRDEDETLWEENDKKLSLFANVKETRGPLSAEETLSLVTNPNVIDAMMSVMCEESEASHPSEESGNPQRKTKGELLEHYASKPVAYFAQFDAFQHIQTSDGALSQDEEGDALCSMHTAELRGSGVPVRIQIAQGVTQSEALRLIDKLRAWIAMPEMARYAEPPFLDPHREVVDAEVPF